MLGCTSIELPGKRLIRGTSTIHHRASTVRKLKELKAHVNSESHKTKNNTFLFCYLVNTEEIGKRELS